MAAEDERFDGLMGGLAQQHTGGIDQLLDTFFGFLRRRTDFFTGATESVIKSTVWNKIEQHKRLADQATERKRKEQESEARRRAEQEAKKQAEQEAKKLQEQTQAQAQVATPAPAPVVEAAAPVSTSTIPSALPAGEKVSDDSEQEGDSSSSSSSSSGLQSPNAGNGGTGPGYRWTQTLAEVEIEIALPGPTRGRDLSVVVTRDTIDVAYKDGRATLLKGKLSRPADWDDINWSVEDMSSLVITLPKENKMEWWKSIVEGHPAIDTQKVAPENSKLSDLDGETRATVEKMMVDQQRKAAGLPTTDEMKKQEILSKFMAQHPEMDFSQAKIM